MFLKLKINRIRQKYKGIFNWGELVCFQASPERRDENRG